MNADDYLALIVGIAGLHNEMLKACPPEHDHSNEPPMIDLSKENEK